MQEALENLFGAGAAIVGLLIFLFFAFMAIMAFLLPLFVWGIYNRVKSIDMAVQAYISQGPVSKQAPKSTGEFKYKVTGLDRNTGEPRSRTYVARNKHSAEEMAARAGIVVEHIKNIGESLT